MEKEKTLDDILKEAKPMRWTNQGNLFSVQFPETKEEKDEKDEDKKDD